MLYEKHYDYFMSVFVSYYYYKSPEKILTNKPVDSVPVGMLCCDDNIFICDGISQPGFSRIIQ